MQPSIENLESSIIQFLQTAQEVKLTKEVYKDGWNAKEIIAHIVFYHEYYAKVLKAIAEKKEHLPLINESLAKVNLKSAKEYSKYSREELIRKFKLAQKVFAQNVIKLNGVDIPYKQGGRIYKAQDYIDTIAKHIAKHTKDLKRSLRS